MIFFGENIPPANKTRAEKTVSEASQMLMVGTSLATYSAYRLLRQAYDAKKGTAMLNVGTSRGDDMSKSFRFVRDCWATVLIGLLLVCAVPDDLRFSLGSSDILSRVALLLSNGQEKQDKVLDTLLRSGVMDPVIDEPGRKASHQQSQHTKNDFSDESRWSYVVNPQ